MSSLSSGANSIDMVILPPVDAQGDGSNVRRVLPSSHRTMIGPFIVLEHLAPATFDPGVDFDAGPHIGLETVTFLIDGEIEYRESLGTIVASTRRCRLDDGRISDRLHASARRRSTIRSPLSRSLN